MKLPPSSHARYGLVPNGGRVYYTRRSQPPVLTQMAAAGHSLANKLPSNNLLAALAKEYQFWRDNRTTSVGPHLVYRYSAPTTEPRLVYVSLCLRTPGVAMVITKPSSNTFMWAGTASPHSSSLGQTGVLSGGQPDFNGS